MIINIMTCGSGPPLFLKASAQTKLLWFWAFCFGGGNHWGRAPEIR